MDYMNPMTLYEDAQKRLREVERLRREVEHRLAQYEPGKIHIVTGKRRLQFYLRTDAKDKSGHYISKKDNRKIRHFLQKRYDEKLEELLLREKETLEEFLHGFHHSEKQIRDLFSKKPPEIKAYLSPVDVSTEDYVTAWQQQVYVGKEISQDLPTFVTNRGEHVRSKSELTIANALAKNGIPYKYECPLRLSNGQTIYPDFTVLNVSRRKVYYWEHRGMMDDREYCRHTVQRLKLLAKAGVHLGQELIITEESMACPLGTDEIEAVIRTYLC